MSTHISSFLLFHVVSTTGFSTNYFMLFSDSEVPNHDIDDKVLTIKSNPHNHPAQINGLPRKRFIYFINLSFLDSKLFPRHMMALTVKRFHHSKRNKKGFICEVFWQYCAWKMGTSISLLLPYLKDKIQYHIKLHNTNKEATQGNVNPNWVVVYSKISYT